MTEKLITTDPPGISIGDFEDLLVTDPVFVHFFNRFLQLPTFPEPLRFNSQNGEFEVISNDKEQLAEKIKNLHRSRNPVGEIYKNAMYKQPIKLPHYEREELERRAKENIEIKTTFRVKCLDKEQGIEWMKRHRLPVFLQSELYNEYRLCRLLAQIETPQQDIRFKVDQNLRPWWNENGKKSQKQQRKDNRRGTSTSKYSSSARSGGKTNKLTDISFTPTTNTGRSFTPSSFDSCRPHSVQQQRQEIADDSNMRYLRQHSYKDETQSDTSISEVMSCCSSVKSSSSGTSSPKYFLPTTQSMNVVRIAPISSDDEEDEKSDVLCDVTNKDKPVDVEGFVDEMVESAIKLAYGSMREETSSINQDSAGDSPLLENIQRENDSNEKDSSPTEKEVSPTNNIPSSLTKVGGGTSNLSKKWMENTGQVDDDEDERNSVFSDVDEEAEEREDKHKFNFKGIKGFDKFRKFIKGTNGEKIFHLWLDIDQSRFMLNTHQTSNYLQRLREVYLTGGGIMQLQLDFLKQHSLHHTSQWKLETLQQKQANLVQPLLLYWAPRFMMHQRNGEIPLKGTSLQRRVDALHKSTSQSFPTPKTITIVPLRPRTCLPHVSRSLHKTTEEEIEPTNSQKRRCAFVIQNMVSNHPHPIFTQPSTIPSYLIPKVHSIQNTLKSDKSSLLHRRGLQSRKIYERMEMRRTDPISENQIKVQQHSAGNSPFPGKKSTTFGRWEMEEMLQALCHDTRAGLFFTNFCEKSTNMMWMHSIHFWFDIQQYRHLFFDETFDEYLVNKRSKTIYGKYIVYGSPEDIYLSGTIRSMITKNMSPPFDELFDDAEEHVLKMLIDPWKKMLGKDQDAYSRVELIEQERNLRISAKYLSSIQKKFVVHRKHPSTPGLSYRSQEEDLWSRVPEEYRDTTFEDLVKNRIELEHLRDFMDANFSKIDLMCWLDAETFKRLPHQADEKREQKAKEFKSKYIHKKYFFGPASPASKQEQNEAVLSSGGWGKTLKERPPNELIFHVQKYAKRRMENKWLPLFLATEAYQERQKSLSKMSEVAEDIILQKKKKRGEPWRLLDSRWQSSSRDVIEFRRGLSNRVTAGQFRRYVGVKGDLLENDVLFWVEVQKYKDFCHIHNDPAAIESKITSIINCFLNSQIPPSLQIDIPTEMGEKILEKRKDLGPYIFREAQVTVFRVLFPHWSGFCEFRKTLGEDKLTYTLERQKRKRLLRMRQQAREQEAALQKEEARIKREATNSFDFGADLFSVKGSETAESYFGTELGRERIEPLAWTYGKHMEELERKRLMLMLENEIEGRVPLAADRELDCSTNRTDTDCGTAVSAKKTSSTLASLQVGQIKRRKSVGRLSQSASYTTNQGNSKGGVRRSQVSVRTSTQVHQHQPAPPQVTVD